MTLPGNRWNRILFKNHSTLKLFMLIAILCLPAFTLYRQPESFPDREGLGTILFLISAPVCFIIFALSLTGKKRLPIRHGRLLGMIYAISGSLLLAHVIATVILRRGDAATGFLSAAYLIASLGLLAIMLLPGYSARQNFRRHIIIVMPVCLVLVFCPLIPSILKLAAYQPQASAFWLGFTGIAANVWAIFLCARTALGPLAIPLKTTLAFFAAGGILNLFAAYHSPATRIPVSEVYHMLAYGPILLPGFWKHSLKRPYFALGRMVQTANKTAGSAASQAAKAERHSKMLLAAASALGAINAENSKLTDSLHKIVQEIRKFSAAEHIFISLREGNFFWIIAYNSTFQPKDAPISHKFMGKQYLELQPVLINDLTEFQHRFRPEIIRAGLKSMAGVPICRATELLGIIELFSSTASAFSPADLEILEMFASQAAAAITKVQILEDCKRKTKEQVLLHEVIQIITSQFSPTILLAKVAEKLGDFLKVDAIAAFIIQRDAAKQLDIRDALIQGFSDDNIRQLKQIILEERLDPLWRKDNIPAPDKLMINLALANQKTVHFFPLAANHTLLGVIVFFWDYNRNDANYQYTLPTLNAIASQIAMGLERDSLAGNIKKFGLTDALTDLANRRFFDYMLSREVAQARRHQQPLSLLMIDIDLFKNINDTGGHLTGDAVLKDIGRLIKKSFRQTDISARYGGEEFAVILPQTSRENAFILAERFRKSVANSLFSVNGCTINLTVSIGVASLELDLTGGIISKADLILAADQALYRAKQSGRNRTEMASSR